MRRADRTDHSPNRVVVLRRPLPCEDGRRRTCSGRRVPDGKGEAMIDSTLYTIGTALRHARDLAVEVQVLVSGQWLHGEIHAVDGHGVVLAAGPHEHAVVRMADIAAVRVLRRAPTMADHELEAHARPMPGPAVAS